VWALAGAAVWVALEMIQAHALGGFPWNLIGVSQYQMTPLIQIASVTGVYGVSFLVVWVSLLLFSAVRAIFSKPHSRYAWQPEIFLPLFVVIGLFAWGEIKLSGQNPPSGTFPVTLVQPSIPQSLIWDESQDQRRFQQLLELSKETLADVSANSHPSQVLIWPESAVPEFDDAAYVAITNFVRSAKIWLIFNADDFVPRPNATNKYDNYDYNAAFQIDPQGLFAGVYHKQKLVIFGEYIPLVDWLPFVKWFTPITGSFAAGNEPVQFKMIVRSENKPPSETDSNATPTIPVSISGAPALVQASPLICFEDTFPQVARKSVQRDTDFLVNLTNDGWFGQSAEQWQHMANAVFRTVENGVPLVRCSNNGITCWIDAQGRIRNVFRDNNGSVYGAGAMAIDLPIQKHAQTFYNRHGDWLGWLSLAVFVMMLGFKIARRGAIR
jgi:apolipoprotein N-acyltransferase